MSLTIQKSFSLTLCTVFESQAISNSLYGLRGIVQDASNTEEVHAILTALCNKVDQYPNSRISMSTQGVGNCVLGLQNKEFASISGLLKHCVSFVKHSSTALDGQSIGSILIALKTYPTNNAEVLVEVTEKLKNTTNIRLKSRDVAIAFSGLQNVDSSNTEALGFLETFIRLAVKNRVYLLNGNDVSTALIGLKTLGGASKVALQYILDSINYGKSVDMNENQLATSFFSLQSMSNSAVNNSDAGCFRGLLGVLRSILDRYPGKLNGRAVANIMYGLQNMQEDEDNLVNDLCR